MGLLTFSEKQRRWRTVGICLALVMIVGAGDYALSSAPALFTLLYLPPVLFASYCVGRVAGASLAGIGVAFSILGEPTIGLAPDRLGELGVLLAVTLLADRLRATEDGAREAARQARGEASRSEAAIAQARESILITDAGGTIRYVNPAFTQTTGYGRDEVLGQNVRLLRSGLHDDAFYHDLWTTILAGRVWRGDITNRRKDGDLFVERTTIVPVRNETGDISHFIALKEDVTERKPVEEALQNEKALSDGVIASLPGIFYVFDRGGRLVRWNRNYETITGSRAQELSGTDILRAVFEADKEHLARKIREAFDSGELQQTECRIRTAGGELRDYLVTGQPTRIGDAQYVVGTGIDITEHKRAADAYQESRQQLAAIIGSAMDAIIGVDEDGRIMLFNAAAEATFRISAADVIGGLLERFIPEPFWQDQRRQLPIRTDGSGGAIRARMAGRRADGEEFPMEVSLSRAAVGDRRLLTAILRDITDRRRAEDEQQRLHSALKNAATEWLRTFDAMRDAVLILDARNRILRLNRAARDLAGGAYADWLGRGLSDLGPREPWGTAAGLVLEAREAGSAASRQIRDAEDRWWHLTTTATADEDDRQIVVARDVTQMVELQESVRHAETMAAMGSLVAGVAHEVRNPLFGISVNVDALAAEIEDDRDLGDVVAALRSDVGRLSVFMENLLEYGKPVLATFSEGPLDVVVDVAIQSCATLAGVADVVVKSSVEPGRWIVRMNRNRLAQVFENLLKNAIQHSPRGSVVRVDADTHGGSWVRCRVSDAGPGMRPEDLPRIFDPFFSRRRGGTGLGLAIVHRIVQEHGGKVYAANGTRGGAVMIAEFPCAAC